jgi:hypothetical protein
VDLTNLPADYDLFVVDEVGTILGQSIQEGFAPEYVDQVLPTGTYYVYVHVDPGRNVDPTQAYTLNVSMQAPVAFDSAAEPTPSPVNAEATPHPIDGDATPDPVAEATPHPIDGDATPYPVAAEATPYPVGVAD